MLLLSSKTALFCLERIPAFDGMHAPNPASEASDDVEDSVLPVDRLIAIADKGGLRLRSAHFDWRELLIATATQSVLLLLRNGNVVVVGGNGRDGVEEIVVSDPLYQNGEPFFLPRLALECAWDGEVLIAKPKPTMMERTLTWSISILSLSGLAAATLLLVQAGIELTAAGANAPYNENSGVISTNRSPTDGSPNETHPTAAATNGNTRPVPTLSRTTVVSTDQPSLRREK